MIRNYVSVQVDSIIREFIIDTHGSDVIKLKERDSISRIIRYHLKTSPADKIKPDKLESTVFIELSDSKSTKHLCDGEKIYINMLYRWFLTAEAQREINSELNKRFKQVFFNFMRGVYAANPEIQQKDAIYLFCDTHNLTLDNVNFEMLKKAWYRSVERKSIKGFIKHVNLLLF